MPTGLTCAQPGPTQPGPTRPDPTRTGPALPTDHAPRATRRDPWRLRDDDALLDLIRPLLGDAGVTRVADLTGLDDVGLPVVSAIRPNARSLAVSAGKGPTLAAATASAVMEALETHAAETARLRLVFTLASAAEVGEPLSGYPRTTIVRDDHAPLLWVEGIDLVTREPRHVPWPCVHTDWTTPEGYGAGWFARDSNGLASGQTRDEAVLHALLELVERDAARCFDVRSEAERRRRRFEPSGELAESGAVVTTAATGRLLACWDLTSDVGVPVVSALLLEADHDPFRPVPAGAGLGCHPDPDRALVRAITEAAQSRLVTIAGARDDLDRGAFQRFFDAAATQALRDQICSSSPESSPGPWRRPATCALDLSGLAARIAELTGHHPIAIDLTPPDWPVFVVRVVAPGLEGAGFGSGTLPGPRAAACAEAGR